MEMEFYRGLKQSAKENRLRFVNSIEKHERKAMINDAFTQFLSVIIGILGTVAVLWISNS